jgi:serine/threonine protein kinase
MPYWLGQTLGKVSVELLLARGGMSEVYLGKHATLQRPVVIKVLNSQSADDPELLDRFQREARAVAMLRHPSIVQVFDFDAIEGHPYIIMEYVPGVSLSAYMRALHKNNQRMDLPLIAQILTPIASALQYAHDTGVIHRDVKPGNILLTSPSTPIEVDKPLPSDVQPVLTDFGLVRFLNSAQQTSTGKIAGTPAYMSPEQARGDPIDVRTDIYSLGIVLYELLAGRVPFEADSTLGVLLKQMNETPPAIPGLPAPLRKVVDKALEKDPSKRYQTPGELAAALNAVVKEETESPTILHDNPGATRSFPEISLSNGSKQNWISAGIIVGAIFLVLGLFAFRNIFDKPASAAAYPTMDMSSSSVQASVGSAGQTVGLLRFQDGSALVDEVTMTATGMPLPPVNSQYEVWLIEENGEQRRSIGELPLDAKGNGTISFVDPEGRNLLGSYNKIEITVEPKPDPSPNPTSTVAFSVTLPAEGLMHVRHLLVSFSGAPNKIGLADGLLKDASLIDNSAQQMLTDYKSGDDKSTRNEAEAILNLLVGKQSPDYKDWNGDGRINDPGDGYGMLLNGDNTGYIQGTYSHADYAASAPDATPNMKLHGEHVKICAQNIADWSPQLRDLMKQILTAPPGTDEGPAVRHAVALSDNILKGTDLNGNEIVEPIPGEGGAQTAYEHAYYMADIVITLKK